jgi:hypothetical protein
VAGGQSRTETHFDVYAKREECLVETLGAELGELAAANVAHVGRGHVGDSCRLCLRPLASQDDVLDGPRAMCLGESQFGIRQAEIFEDVVSALFNAG